MQVKRLHNSDEFRFAYAMIDEYMRWDETVTFEEFMYYTYHFAKLRKWNDYMVYRAMEGDKTWGIATMVLLDNLLLIECFVVPEEYRDHTNEVLNEMLNVAKTFGKPIVAEVRSEKFCKKLCNLFNFERFEEPYTCIVLKDEMISEYPTNLLYLSESTMNFNKVKNTLYEQYYFWWKKHYYNKLLKDYESKLNVRKYE